MLMHLYFYGLTAARYCISQWLHIVLYLSVAFSLFSFPDMEKAKCFHASYFNPRNFVAGFFPHHWQHLPLLLYYEICLSERSAEDVGNTWDVNAVAAI